MLEVTLFGRPGCHLCDQVRDRLNELSAQFDLRVDEINIELDHELHRRYLERIPVLEVGGQTVCELDGCGRDTLAAKFAELAR